MKNRLVLVAAALLIGALAHAQNAGPRGGAPGAGQRGQAGQGQKSGFGRPMMGMRKEMMDKLNLTAAQKSQIEKLDKAQMEKMQAMRDKMKASGKQPDRDTFRTQAKTMRESYVASLKKILTPAQFTKMEALQKEMREKFQKEHPGGPGGPGGPAGKGGKAGKGGGKPND